MAALALPAELGDKKTELNHFCQRYCQRPVTKQDIVYTTNKFGNQYQAIVKLVCVQGQEFAGHLCVNQKDAEKDAAEQALKGVAALQVSLPAPVSKDAKKKKPPLTPAQLAEKKARQAEEGDNPAVTAKTKLNTLVMKIVKRYLQKGETEYECKKYTGGYQATVKLKALPGEWGTRAWAGHVCSTKQKAEQSAAEIALQQITEDKELAEEAAKPKGFGKGGKGKGKGKEWLMPPWMLQMMGRSGSNLPRQDVSQEQVVGEVIEWKDHYGWIQPASPIDHPDAKKHHAKIYVNKKDVSGQALSQGAKVKFTLYDDPLGLGAKEVTVLS